MTERQIQYWLFRDLAKGSRLIVPRYTPAKWFECDVFRVLKSGRWEEYEIKLSVSDFLRDADKCAKPTWRWVGQQRTDIIHPSKHQRLCEADVCGPGRFWYVLPEHVLGSINTIPEFAGVKIVRNNGKGLYFTLWKPAPQIHAVPVSKTVEAHALSVCYWRMWHESHRVNELTKVSFPQTKESA